MSSASRRIRFNSHLPHKKSKLHPLRGEQKADNRQLSRKRFVVEHAIRNVKIFRILAERCRNQRKRSTISISLLILKQRSVSVCVT